MLPSRKALRILTVTYCCAIDGGARHIERDFTLTVDKVQRSVVAIVQSVRDPRGFDDFLPIGTAFFVSSQGHLLTNAHVIVEANKIRAEGGTVALRISATFTKTRWRQLPAGSAFVLNPFDTVARDDQLDVAIIKPKDPDFEVPTFLEVSDSDPIKPGVPIAMTGFPLWQDVPVTTRGTIATIVMSSPVGFLNQYHFAIFGTFFLTDVPIQKGSSGSPVYLVETGTVVGIASAFVPAPVVTLNGTAPTAVTSGFVIVRPLERAIELMKDNSVPYTNRGNSRARSRR
jgi:S1-C subfamily serine protease